MRHHLDEVTRRGFLLTAGVAVATVVGRRPSFAADVDPLLAGRPLARSPEKTVLILLPARPPQLETPLSYFDRAITPNDAFFVRYHVFPIPTSVDLDPWRLEVKGHVDKPLSLSMDDLKKFPRASVTAAAQCSGNSPGRFAPRVLGGPRGGRGATARGGTGCGPARGSRTSSRRRGRDRGPSTSRSTASTSPRSRRCRTSSRRSTSSGS